MTTNVEKPLPENEETGTSRRGFLLGGTAAVAGTAAVGFMFKDGFEDPFLEPTQHGTGSLVDAYTERDVIHSMCMQCNTFCTIKVRLTDGGDTGATALVRKIAGNPYSPLTTQPVGPIPYDTSLSAAVTGIGTMSRDSRSRSGGIACLKGQAGPQVVHDSKRVTQPLRRIGERGSGEWETITWEEALRGIMDGDDKLGTPGINEWYAYVPQGPVMDDWQKVKDGDMTAAEFESAWGDKLMDPKRPELGPRANGLAVMGGDRQPLLQDRWTKQSFGSINAFNHGGTCGVTGVVANARSHPKNGFKRMYADIDYCRYLIVWGAEPVTANKGPTFLAPRIGRARENGMKMVVIDPRMSKTGEKADVWMPVKPGHDSELAWAMIRWIIDNERYDENFLRAAGPESAAAVGEPNWSDGTHLIKVDEENRGPLTMRDAGLETGVEPDENGEMPPAERACFVDGELVGADTTAELADLDVDTEVDGPDGPIRVRSVFNMLKERALAKDIDELAEECGIPAEQIISVARDFTSHGKRAAVTSYRGAAMHANGFDAIRAIGYLNFLIGNHDWKGGHITGQKQYDRYAGLYDLEAVPEARQSWGVPVTREKVKYETTSFFEEDGYPAKRRWFQYPGNLCHEVIPSAAVGYPYSLDALFIYRHSPINSSPEGHRLADKLKMTDAIRLVVSFDVTMGDTSAYADYVLPDQTYLERFTNESIYPAQQYAVAQMGQPTTRAFKDPRPVEETFREIGVEMGLPGVGENAFGDGAHWNTYEDYWLKVAANMAYADEPVPDADGEEMSVFLDTRKTYLKDAFNEDQWRAAVKDEEWAKVVYILNRGGRFEEHGEEHANGYEGEWLKYRYEGLCQFYDPNVAGGKDPMTGEYFDGLADVRQALRSDGTSFKEDGYPLQFINWKARHQGTHRTVNSAWLREVRPSNFVTINPVDARERGIETGDEVKVKSSTYEAIGVAMLTETIRPGVVGADASFGHEHYGAKTYTIDGTAVEPPARYGHEESARKITPMHEETGYAGPRGGGVPVNSLMADDTVMGGGGVSDPVGGGASQLDTWIEVTKA